MQIEITREIAAKVLSVVDQGLSKGVGTRREGPVQGEMCVEAAVCYALGLPHGDDPGCVAPSLRTLKIRLNDANWSSNEARGRGLRRLAIAQLGSAGELDEKEFRKRIVDIAIRVSTPVALRSAASILKNEKQKASLYEAANRCEKEGTRQAALDAKKAAEAAANAAAAEAYTAAYAAYATAAAEAAANAAANAADAEAYAAAYTAVNAAADAADAEAYAADAAAYTAYADATAAAYTAANAADAEAYAEAYAAAAAAYAAYADAANAAADVRDKSLSDYAEQIVQVLIEMKAPGCQWLELTEIA